MTVTPPQTSVRVRQAARADLSAIHRIEQAVFPQPWPPGAFEQFLGTTGFLVADDGVVVGYVVADVVAGHGRPVGHVKDIAVRADRRREGVGSTLLERGIERLPTDIERVRLEVRESNSGAIDLYRRHGFTYRRRLPGYYADGEDGLVFTRPVR